jgi:hypothetical protein
MHRGNVVMIFADAGWKYLGTHLWSQDAPEDERSEERLDDTIWW